jgi:hypothetical protein
VCSTSATDVDRIVGLWPTIVYAVLVRTA